MQAAEEQSRVQEKGPDPGFLSPGRAFALLVGVILALGLIIFVTRPDPSPEIATNPTDTDPPTFELTDAEALARFEQLYALFRQGSRDRDPSLIAVAMTSDSPLRPVALEDIAQLERDKVLDRSRFSTLSVEILENSPDEIRIQQAVLIDPRFISERTREEVSSTGRVRQTVEWILRFDDGTWKVFDAVRHNSRPVRA